MKKMLIISIMLLTGAFASAMNEWTAKEPNSKAIAAALAPARAVVAHPTSLQATQNNSHTTSSRILDKEMKKKASLALHTTGKDTLKNLLNSGLDANIIVNKLFGNTLLISAIWSSHDNENIEKIKMLIQAGANVNIADKHGKSPLTLAVQYRSRDNFNLAELLLAAGADINQEDLKSKTPLMVIAMQPLGYYNDKIDKEVQFLIEKGANVNMVDNNGWTALMYAIQGERSLQIIQLLVENNALVSHTAHDGTTPISLAKTRNDPAILDYLKIRMNLSQVVCR